MTYIIKNRYTNEIIFEGNSLIGADLREANLVGDYLRGVDLTGANLIGANLVRADLKEAILIDADLFGANLIEAYLRGADLTMTDLREASLLGADLRGATLKGANLVGANLREAKGVKRLMTHKYDTYIIGDFIAIGCKAYTIKEWESFRDADINAMDDGALEWWKENKEYIIAEAKKFNKEID